jgi:hypothetical protein
MAAFSYDDLLKAGTPGTWLVDSTKIYKQGQFVNFNSGTKFVEPAVDVADGPTVVGVAGFTAPKDEDPFGTSEPFPTEGKVDQRGIFQFNGKSGEVYTALLPVEIDPTPADGQSVRLNSSGSGDVANIVGYVAPNAGGAAAGITITGAVRKVPIWITPQGIDKSGGLVG